MMKNLVIAAAVVGTVFAANVASANEVATLEQMFKASKVPVIVRSFDLKKGHESEGGQLVASKFMEVDSVMGVQGLCSEKSKEFTLASPLSDKTRVTFMWVNGNTAKAFHNTFLAVNANTQARNIGSTYRWTTEKIEMSAELANRLAAKGLYDPVRMTVISGKIKDPKPQWIKFIQGAAGIFSIGKGLADLGKPYNNGVENVLNGALTLGTLYTKTQAMFGGAGNISNLSGGLNGSL